MRKKIKVFFHILINSLLPSKSYYNKILIHSKLLFSLKYILTLILIGVFFIILIFSFKNFILTNKLDEVKKGFSNGLERFPEDLVIIVENNQLRTNYGRPYIFWLKGEKMIHPFLVIDERATEEKINQYDHGSFLLTANKIVMKREGKIFSYPLKTNNLVFDRKAALILKDEINNLFTRLNFLIPLILVFSFLALSGFFFVKTLFWLAFLSLGFYLFLKVKNIKTTYSHLLALAIHSNTIPLMYEFLVFIIIWGYRLLPWYLVFSFIFMALAVYEVYFSSHHPHYHPVPAHHPHHPSHHHPAHRRKHKE